MKGNVSIPSNRGKPSDISSFAGAAAIAGCVSIPSNRGKPSDKECGFICLTEANGLNPLKSGQAFGPKLHKNKQNGGNGLNPLKSGQAFGPK